MSEHHRSTPEHMDAEGQRELEIQTTLAEGRPVTQRALAARLGIALGLANLYLKRLARKGYIKLTTIPPNRIRYLVTPQGFAQKSRLTYEYMRYSLRLYREARQGLREALARLARDGATRIALYGTGEAAELAYLTLMELGLEPAGVLSSQGGSSFLGRPVLQVATAVAGDYDRVVVATFDDPSPQLAELEKLGFARDRLITLDEQTR